MTIKEFIEEWEKNPNKELAKAVIEGKDVWSNDACRGYIIKAMKELDYKEDEIREIVKHLYSVFDFITVTEAEEIYHNF